MNIKKKLFSIFVKNVILVADPYFSSRSLGIRETNPKYLWMKKAVIDIYEEALGKERFRLEYESGDIEFDEDIDYLGSILRKSLEPHLGRLYRKDLYASNKNKELNRAIDAFVKDNIKYCLKLFASAFIRKMKCFLRPIKRYILVRVKRESQNKMIEKTLQDIAKYYGNNPVGLFLGLDWEFQSNFIEPVLIKFKVKDFPVLYVRRSYFNHNVEKREWGCLWNVKMPYDIEIFRDRKLREDFKRAKKRQIIRIQKSRVKKQYKNCLTKKMDEVLKEYCVCCDFHRKLIGKLRFSFVFCLPDKLIFQRSFLSLIRKNRIPSFTYEPVFSTSEKTMNEWGYLSKWVLLTCKIQERTLQKFGFSKERIKVVGSILADFQINSDKCSHLPLNSGLNVLLLTKATHKSFNNEPLIKAVIEALIDSKKDFNLYVKPHPADRTKYDEFKRTYPQNIVLINKVVPLRKLVSSMDLLVSCGNSYSIFECLPSRRKIFVIDTAHTSDNSLLHRNDLKNHIFYYEDLGGFKRDLALFVKEFDPNASCSDKIPQSVVDDFFLSLDGKTANRICEFVLSQL